MNRSRPNTLVPDDLLHADVILCCGEDKAELLHAFNGYTAVQTHEYRCYHFWKYDAFTLIWTGIGTGCLEPLLFEILEPGIVQRIVLIGTAGALNSNAAVGTPLMVREARLGCTGITRSSKQPLKPRWSANLSHLPSASIVSTDYYYGFSKVNSPLVQALQHADARLTSVMADAATIDLVDMECAQFYHLCKVLGDDSLQFVALKGASNPITDISQQTLHSKSLLTMLACSTLSLLKTP